MLKTSGLDISTKIKAKKRGYFLDGAIHRVDAIVNLPSKYRGDPFCNERPSSLFSRDLPSEETEHESIASDEEEEDDGPADDEEH